MGYLPAALEFIKQAPTLVHCNAGVSRSGAIIVAFLMQKHSLEFDEALK
ncbi:MAG: dual specificity protein phosphatase family protein, partial [bacterium]